MATRQKYKTNEQMIGALVRSLSPIEAALLRERLQKVSELTRASATKNPDAYAGPCWNAAMFVQLCDKIDAHLIGEDERARVQAARATGAQLREDHTCPACERNYADHVAQDGNNTCTADDCPAATNAANA